MSLRRSVARALVLSAFLALPLAGCTEGSGPPGVVDGPSADGGGAPAPSATDGDGPGDDDEAGGDGAGGDGAGGDGAGGDEGAGGDDAGGDDGAGGDPDSGDGGSGDGDGDGDDGDDDGGDDGSDDSGSAPFVADTSADHADPTGVGDTFLSVTDIRTGRHDGYDRVVFDLAGKGSGTPGWDVRYVPEARDDGSGARVDVDGGAILEVRISGTAMPSESGVTEASRTPFSPAGTEAVEEIVYRTWFEGYSTAFVGVDEKTPFRVHLLKDPVRVVLDIQH